MSDITSLIEKLTQYDREYNTDGESSISDREYDQLRRKAEALDPGNAYFASVGSDVRGDKEKLPYTMGSLDQIYDQKEWDNWVKAYDLSNKEVVISDKQDGISAMLIYRYGMFEKAFSRGNGMEGADISRHVRGVPSVVKDLTANLGHTAYIAIRAELIMPIGTFESKYTGTFKNPRNMVAGCFNRSTTGAAILRDIECITYQVVAYSNAAGISITRKSHELELLAELGFKVTPWAKYRAGDLGSDKLVTFVKNAKARSKTELDGVVVTMDRYDDVDSQRRSKTTLNPEHSIKYKVSTDAVIAEVVDVLWEVSKSGFFKPRVQIKPIEFGGVTITYATGFNGKFIHDNGIGPGAKVKITRSGDVIPYITEVIASVAPKMPKEDYDWNENGVEIVTTDDNNPEVKFKLVLSFFESLQVELLKEATLREVFAKRKFDTLSYEDIITTVFDLTEIEWVKLVGANGAKIAASLRRRGENMTYDLFFGATKYMGFGFGVRKAKALMGQIEQEVMLDYTVDQLAALDGFDVKTATKIHAGMPKALKLMDELFAMGAIKLVTVTKTAEMKGLVVVFTGFRDADLHETIEKAGGKVGSSVSSKTTHLLSPVIDGSSSKFKKAKELGVLAMTPDQFKDTYNL